MKTILKILSILTGIILAPLLYARYGLIVLVTLVIIYVPNEGDRLFTAIFAVAIHYIIFFIIIMGQFGLMKYWAGLWLWLFKVDYYTDGFWNSNMMHSASVWEYPVLVVNGKRYNISYATMGGKTYNEDSHIRRKALMFSLIRW